MLSFSNKTLQLKIYYLFMLVDGKCTKDEVDKFETICKSMDVNTDDKREVISFCEEAIRIKNSDNSAQVIQETKKLLENNMGIFSLFGSIKNDKKEHARIIWTLINLGYADVNYSESEKRVVSFLADYWNLYSVVFTDMYDTAETILVLTKQKEWLKTTNKSYDSITAGINEINKNIEQMFKNIELLISEADIA